MERLHAEQESLRSRLQVSQEETAGLKLALSDSRANNDRLHRESELVVQNVNTWVREQK